MTYGLADIKHLNIMADLANKTPVKPAEVSISALLNTEHQPTVDEQILSLCSKLRADGFERQASSLEQKFLIYRTATTHLYRAIDEDGEDLVDAAHPDGENPICDADKDLGTVETIVTRHKKIVDVVNKQPTGKLASVGSSLRSLFAELGEEKEFDLLTRKKVADDANVPFSTISAKFKTGADYLDTNFLKKREWRAQSKTPEEMTFWDNAIKYFNLFQDLTVQFNVNNMGSPEAILTNLKNALRNTVAMTYIPKLNVLQNIDSMINDTLDWFNTNKPMSINAQLSRYVDQCAKIVNAQDWSQLVPGVGELARPLVDTLELGSFLKKYTGSIYTNADATTRSLRETLLDPNIQKHPTTMDDINAMIEALHNLMEQSSGFIDAEAKHDVSALTDYITMLNDFKSVVAGLKQKLTLIDASRDLSDKFLEGFNKSSLRLSLENLSYLERAIVKTIGAWQLLKIQPAEVGSNTPRNKPMTFQRPSVPPAQNPDVKTQELTKLQSWQSKTTKNPAHQQQFNAWVAGQIKELQAASTPEQVSKVVEENKQFQAKGII